MSLARSSAPIPNLEWVIDRSPLMISVETPLKQAIAILYQAKAPCGLVVTMDQTLVGILTERDILRSCVETQNLDGLSLREAMAQPVVSLAEADLDNRVDLGDHLARLKKTYLPLVDKQGRVTGLISQARVEQILAMVQEQQRWLTRYQLAEQASSQILYQYNFDQNRFIWGINFEKILGYSPTNAPKFIADWQSLIHPDDLASFRLSIQIAMDQNSNFQLEYRVRHQSGHYQWIQDRNQRLQNENGQPIAMVGIINDISQHKEDEPKLAASGAKLQEAQRLAKIGSDDGKVLGYLGTITDITERKQAELERQTVIAKLEEVVQQLQLAQQEIGQNNRLLKTITTAQARFITAADRLTIFDELLTNLLDLTESEYGFIGEVLFRDNGTATMDNNLIKIKGIPYVKTHSMTNIAWDEETQKLYEDNYQKGMEFTNMNTLFGAVIMTGKPVIANNPHTDPRRGGTPNGHPALNAFLGLPFFRGNTLMGMVGIANCPGGYDEGIIAFLAPFLITCSNLIEGYRGDRQRRQAEAQLQLTNEELLRVTRLKDEFLANMSHELRTPLNAILGNTEILEDELFGPINAQQLTSLHTITKSSHHLLALINDILDVAKIESGQIELHYSAIAIPTLCQTCMAFITPQAQKRKIQLQTHISPELPNLRGDERRMRQVLINLLNNAVKFTPDGGTISLTVSLQASKPPNTFPLLRFAIADTGIGITPDNLTKLFRPFIQIDSALNRQYEGTGLGLALVKQIVELHGGEVGVTSQWGEGSCFTVDFPYNPTE